MGDERTVSEVIVELNPDGKTVWRARVDELGVIVDGDTVAAAEAAALAAVITAPSALGRPGRARSLRHAYAALGRRMDAAVGRHHPLTIRSRSPAHASSMERGGA